LHSGNHGALEPGDFYPINANRRTTIPPPHRENRGDALRNSPRLSSQQVSTDTLLRGQRRCRRRKWLL